MKNKHTYILIFILMNMLIFPHANSKEIFNFNVTEIEILQKI